MWSRVWARLRARSWSAAFAACAAWMMVACGGGSDTAATTGPSVVSINFVSGDPARLEVTFSEPMNPTYYTTGGYVPTSSVWETTTKFVITFSSVSPGGFITLKAPTAGDPRGFRSADGRGLPSDVNYQFGSGGTSSAPRVFGFNFVATAPARLEVTFTEPMSPDYATTGDYVPTSSVWESSTRFVITFSSFTPGGNIVLKAPTGGASGFKSARGVGMETDVSIRFPAPGDPPTARPVVSGLNFIAAAPARLEVSFSEPMSAAYSVTGPFGATSGMWETTTKFVFTVSSIAPGGTIVLKSPTNGSPGGFWSATGTPMATDVPFTFPLEPPAGSGAPAVTGLTYVAADPARLAVTFSEPMNPAYATTGAYVPASSVWETTTTFVVTFSSVTPGGVITLKAPTPGDATGFRSAAGTGLAAGVPFQFPSRN